MKKSLLIVFALALFTVLTSCEKNRDSTTFHWDETGCADPWEQTSADTDEERKDAIENYLDGQNVQVDFIEFDFDSAKVELCEACNCLTGRVITVKTSWLDKRKMKRLGFYQE